MAKEEASSAKKTFKIIYTIAMIGYGIYSLYLSINAYN
jgi:hypothetical protein